MEYLLPGLRDAGALVTGASRGIGRATALLLGQAGARVAVAYHANAEAANGVAAAITQAGGVAHAVQADVSRSDGAEALAATAAAQVGPLRCIVANAGTWRPTPFPGHSDDQWESIIRENLTSKALTVRAALAHAADDARIVLVSSTAGQRGESGFGAYAAAQGGTIALVKSLAAELGPRGLRVNGVAPGWVATGMSNDAIAGRREEILAGIPLGRIAEADDIAGPIVFLLSDLARHVHGEIVNVNGGSVLCG